MSIRRAILAAALLAPVLATAAAAEDLRFTIINNSSHALREFYVSPGTQRTWGRDLMPRGYELPAGNRVEVLISDGRDHCEYDIKAVWADGNEFTEMGANLCDLGEWTFTD
jgi:hypothetical protein